jgi:methylenetetrahydrofolate dehydrogenase (NADP+)/methenyltetrahydrofolate cyclohydrolase
LLQLPLPAHLNANEIIAHIAPKKDVDGLTPINMGYLLSDQPQMIPCTPQGVMELLNTQCTDLTGKHAVVIGRSLLFGKPMGQLLLNANCTVTHCHSKTVGIKGIAKQADILIAATGRANMINDQWVKDGAIVIDVGITRDEHNKITGDVDFDTVSTIASAITPVPGGVGPMTVACLLKNTAQAAGIT